MIGNANLWLTSTTSSDTAPNNAFASDPSTVNDILLTSPQIAISTAAAQLTFRNNYNLEFEPTSSSLGYDGGVLEIAINNGAFIDIITAGGSFITGGYNRTISASFSNPIGGRQAWSGSSGGYITTTVNLPATAAGKNINLRWRLGTDNTGSGTGWRIDTITILDGVICQAGCTALCPTVININPTSGAVGSNVTLTGTNFNGVTSVKFLQQRDGAFHRQHQHDDHRHGASGRRHRPDHDQQDGLRRCANRQLQPSHSRAQPSPASTQRAAWSVTM